MKKKVISSQRAVISNKIKLNTFFLLKTKCRLPTSDNRQLTTEYRLPATDYRLLITVLLVTAYCFLLLSGCTEKDQMYKESRVLMDTFCSITVVASSRERAKEAIDAGFAEIQKLENLLNYFSAESELSAINKAAGTIPVKVSRETIEILLKAMTIAEDTDGAFDPTVAPVIRLWKFSKVPAESVLPSGEAVQRALQRVGYRKVAIDRGSSEVLLEERGMEIDLGGIAKGYAADKAVLAIQSLGIQSALVAIAGDIRGFGLNSSQQPWKVGVQNPRPEADSDKPWEDIFASIQLKNSAISTSGDYQRFLIHEGKRYHHILDPQTGYPAESGLISSTVIAPEGYLADGLSTAVFILGAERGIQLLESNGLGGVLVDNEKNIYITRNLRNSVDIVRKEYRLADR